MVYIYARCPSPVAGTRKISVEWKHRQQQLRYRVKRRKKTVSAKAKMKKMARHLDLFSFFCADISLYMVFDLTIIRCNTM